MSERKTTSTLTRPGKRPVLPQAKPVGEQEMRAYWRMLRVFFRTGKGGGIQQLYPALLGPWLDLDFIPGDYPLWADETGNVAGLSLLLRRSLKQMAPEEGAAKILVDNLPRLERIIAEKLAFADIVYEARAVFEEALQDLSDTLAIAGKEGETFAGDVAKLKEVLPKGGILLPFTTKAPFHLLSAFLGTFPSPDMQSFRDRIHALTARLKEILAAEREKGMEARSEEHLQETLDFAGSFLRFDELSSLLPSAEEDAIPEERLHRIEKILSTLEEADALLFQAQAQLLVTASIKRESELDGKQDFPGRKIQLVKEGKACKEAVLVFDRQMKEVARLFAAVRLARLEIDHLYQPEVHADFFAHFDWRSFTEEELSACPPVILITDAANLEQGELNEFSALLSSSRPIKLLVLNSGPGMRQELGALAVAHRNTFVLQTTTVDPLFIMEGLREGFQLASPALFYLYSTKSADLSRNQQFVKISAAAESREFPAFVYNHRKGPKWGSRFDIKNNPQPTADWPELPLAAADEEEKELEFPVSFTFADFAAQENHFSDQFHLVPPEYWNDDLIPLHHYLNMAPEENIAAIPFVWMVDPDHRLQKVAVAWPLVIHCLDRLDFWHYLQENAGIHSFHVEQATLRLRQEIEDSFAQKISALEEAHQEEVQKVQEETARAAMERLAASLLELDPAVTISSITREAVEPSEQTKRKPEPEVEEEKSPPEPEVEEEETLSLGEAWVETPLCTSCNECLDLNKRIFQYNADKQAYVANPLGGPFSDIVKAAEKCPVKIIHPGAPQDPNEEGLDGWVKRAERFN